MMIPKAFARTLGYYIGLSPVFYLLFLLATIVAAIFLLKLIRKLGKRPPALTLLIFIFALLGVGLFPYGLFESGISSLHQIFAELTFLSGLTFALSLLLEKTKPLYLVFIAYALAFIFAYRFRFAPFRATILIWETLYFLLLIPLIISLSKETKPHPRSKNSKRSKP